MKKMHVCALTLAGVAITTNAQAFDVAVGAHVSTLGAGVEVTTPIVPSHLNVRGGVHWAEYGIDAESDGVDYDADLELFSGLIAADWHPFQGRFRITGGVLLNDNKVTGRGEPNPGATYTINDTVYAATNVGRLDAEISYNTAAPYLGIGWGNPVGRDSNWTMFADIGVAFLGSPDVDLEVSGPLATNAAFRADLEQEKKDLEDDLDSYTYYPVIKVGVTYKF
ncbi:MAG: hypothetical protein C0613_00780 [Desulfobulbaceae bacterium]|nr:MAG: hypothetical protein C0613_00780 [Desulfobulbaceae bacterium]